MQKLYRCPVCVFVYLCVCVCVCFFIFSRRPSQQSCVSQDPAAREHTEAATQAPATRVLCRRLRRTPRRLDGIFVFVISVAGCESRLSSYSRVMTKSLNVSLCAPTGLNCPTELSYLFVFTKVLVFWNKNGSCPILGSHEMFTGSL